MEVKNNSHMGYKNITKTERKCNSCGFATFCLRVLYQHKYKCQGQLLGLPLRCGYCKRRYTFPFLLKRHQKTCVKRNKKKKTCLRKFKKQNEKATNGTILDRKCTSKPSTIVCPVCMKFFSSRVLYAAHEQSGVCQSKPKIKNKFFSARKSFPKTPVRYKKNKFSDQTSDSDMSLLSDNLLSDIIDRERSTYKFATRGYMCIRCKNKYPAKVILLKHLELNYRCALAHLEQSSYHKTSHKARKTLQPVVARKSFSYASHRSRLYQPSKIPYHFEGSARKSLSNSSHRQSFKSHLSGPSAVKRLNQCPVCYEQFHDSFNFYQHQKKLNHWGKATKSVSLSCKCPFCQKEFFSVRARNAHIRNHADRSDQIIKSFLKSTTCDICSQIFVSETLKLQHIKIEHSKPNQTITNNTESLENDSAKYVSLPLVIKQQLKQYPFSCPVCAKEFVATSLRNKHFEENHLDSDLECKFCPIKCSSSELLNNHMKQLHYEQFKYECSQCKSKFPTVSHMMLHNKKFHSNNNPKRDLHRGAESLSQQKPKLIDTEKIQNRELQGKRPCYFCDICNVGFQKLQFLRRHEQTDQHRNTLIKSLDAVHESLSNLPPSPPPSLPKQIQTPDILSCSECFEEFTVLKDFVPHRLSHFSEQGKYMEINEENTYTCEICGDISDSHSKVQLHLFWHLQVESTSKEKKSSDIARTNPTSSNKSSGQHVAKKSFGKQSRETHQEVVIGGVTKHLFTCEACHIGFTNQAHYNLHVRRFCTMKNNISPKKTVKDVDEIVDEETTKSSSASDLNLYQDKMEKIENDKEDTQIEQCDLCNCLFNTLGKEAHDEFCSKCRQTCVDLHSDVDNLKSLINLQKAVAACLKCGCTFDTSQHFSQHMISDHSHVENSETSVNKDEAEVPVVEGENVIHCLTCNCIFFSTDVLEDHENICLKFSYGNSKLENFTPDFKAVLEQNSIIASCITCDLAFNNTEDLSQHIALHQNNTATTTEQESEVSLISESLKSPSDEKMDTSEPVSSHNEQNQAVPESLTSTSEYQELSLNVENSSDISKTSSDVQVKTVTDHKDISIDSSGVPSDEFESVIDKLRKNFSQLLSILVSDPDLMQQLGYGELTVDEVLVKVLEIMQQTPVLKDENTSELECLRKNIQILLDVCLEDQVMAVIGDENATTDDIVVEALKIFGGESSMSIIALE